MHTRLMMAFVALFLIVAVAVPLATAPYPQQAGAAGGGQAPSKAAPGKAERAEHHPVIHRAIKQLEHTKMMLNQEGARDFEGHRAKAVQEIDEALAELHKALEADKK